MSVETPDRSSNIDALVDAARAARANAYARYTDYAVGAAIETDVGRFSGCNVENRLPGATVCAERVAVWTAVAAGARRVRALAVVTPDGGTPCGFCRQVLVEHAAPDLPIVTAGPGPDVPVRTYTLGELLPSAWQPDELAGDGGS